MMNYLRREYEVFKSCPRPMQVLLVANMIYGFVLPVIDIFISAYVMRNTRDVVHVICFPLGLYIGTPVAFALNGVLLRRLGVKYLYAGGMMLSGIALLVLMQIHVLTPVAIVMAGILMGIASGFFWANRQFLVLTTTTDASRNYYYGLELFIETIASVVVPLLVGWFISGTTFYGWMGGVPNQAYLVIAMAVLILSMMAAYLVIRGNFVSPKIGKFIYWKFDAVWWRMLLLANFKGMAQGYILAMPAILIMLFVGMEGTLGVIESVGGLLIACILYLVGRLTTPAHRGAVFAAGLSLFAIGSLLNAFLFDMAGVLGFQVCYVVSKPMLDLAYWPIELQVVDHESITTGRDRYAYLMNHEIGLLHGRILGCGLMIVLALSLSGTIAVRFAMPAVALLQLLSIPVYARLKSGIARELA